MDYSMILCLGLYLMTTTSAEIPMFAPEMVHFVDRDGQYYSYLTVDKSTATLYAGAMERIYRLNSDDISNTGNQFAKSDSLPSRAAEKSQCDVSRSHPEYQCRNHIRSIAVQSNGDIKVCSTGAHAPLLFHLDKVTLQADSYPPSARNTGSKLCPPDPSYPFTSLLVENGNPNDEAMIYVGNRDHAGSYIYRPQPVNKNFDALSTKGLNEHYAVSAADFVASFESQNYVYFFFNEYASEIMPTLTKRVARVGRVCKSDEGGNVFLGDTWTSFVKTTLECSVSGVEPFYFGNLRAVEEISDVFYALFTTPEQILNGSAVCAFTRENIDNLFKNGKIMEKQNDNTWSVMDETQQNATQNRPGKCYSGMVNDVVKLNFISTHSLIQGPVAMENGQPTFYRSGLLFTRFQATSFESTQPYVIFYMATDDGLIHKVAFDRFSPGQQGMTVAIWNPFQNDVSITQMLLYENQLYITTKDEVLSMPRAQCSKYLKCTQCVLDPMCGWDASMTKCRDWENTSNNPLMLRQSPFHNALTTCGDACFTFAGQLTGRIPGDPMLMKCDSVCEVEDVDWVFQPLSSERKNIVLRDDKYILTENKGLLLLNATSADNGQYVCSSKGVNLVAFNLLVPDCDESDPDCIWKEEFRKWCEEFSTYQSDYNQWLCMKDSCMDNPQCQASDVTQCVASTP